MTAALWTAKLERPLTEGEEAVLLAALPPERRKRLPRRRTQWREPLCAYGLLRAALRERYGWQELPAMSLTARGKPYFQDFPQVQFSLSHTDGAVLVGLSDQPVGVDIERIRPPGPHLLRRMGEDLSPEAFFQIWVRREARAKCGGEGVSALLRPEPPLEPGEIYCPVETFPGYAAGAAVRGTDLPGSPRALSLEELLRAGAPLRP